MPNLRAFMRTFRRIAAFGRRCDSACWAAQARVDLFITNDERLSTTSIPHIDFVSSLQRAFL